MAATPTPQLAKAPGAPQAPPEVTLTGAQKSVLFLLSIDESVAVKVLAHLEPEEIRNLRKASEAMKEVDPSIVVQVHKEFAGRIRAGLPLSLQGSDAYLRTLAGRALGETQAATIWSGQKKSNQPGPVDALAALDEGMLRTLLGKEHPQTIAVIISQMSADKSPKIFSIFDEEKQRDILQRMLGLKSVPESTIKQIEDYISSEIANIGEKQSCDIDGKQSVVSLIKGVDKDTGEALLDMIAKIDADTASDIKNSLFTFEELIKVDDRGMQVLLKDVPSEKLVLTLKTASPELKEKIFRSVSSRAAAMLKYELDMLGRVRLSDVEEARQLVVTAALALEAEGKIQIDRGDSGSSGGGDFV